MAMPKIAYSPKGLVHFSVGAILKKDDKYLLIERASPPEGFACVAGHVDAGENEEQAVRREVKEEASLDVRNCKLLFEKTIYGNVCSKGIPNHHWKVFECEVLNGKERKNNESKSVKWYSPAEIKTLKLEPVWDMILKELKII